MKTKKPTLKEEFLKFFDSHSDEGGTNLPIQIWNFFEPHLKKKSPAPKPELPIEKIVEYNEMFPKIKSKKTGKYLRCNVTEVTKSFERFFKTYEYDWDTIMTATNMYLHEEENKNFEWTVRSKYFVTKLKDSVEVSELAEYCAHVLEGGYFEGGQEQQGHEPKIL